MKRIQLEIDLMRIEIDHYAERIIMWMVWHMPKPIVMWATIRLHTNATYVYPERTPDQINIWEALKAWDK